MSRSSSPAQQRYSEILALVLSGESRSDVTGVDNGKPNVEDSLSALHNTRKQTFHTVGATDSVGEEAKRMFREKRQFNAPSRSVSMSSAEVHRQDLSPGSIFGRKTNQNTIAERRTRIRRFPSPQGQVEAQPKQKEDSKERLLRRSFSLSSSQTRENDRSRSSINNSQNRPLYQELRDEESIRRFSRSSARTRAYEMAANRAVQSSTETENRNDVMIEHTPSSRRTISLSPVGGVGNSDRGQVLPRSPSSHLQKEREILSLRQQLGDLQEHLSHITLSQDAISKRLGKKQQAMESIVVELEDTKRTVQVQRDHISFIGTCLRERDEEIALMRQELEDRKKTCSKLELELEVHDLKFSIYDDYRRLMDKQKLDRKIDFETHLDDDLSRAKLNNQEQDYLSILSRLDDLETMYRQDLSDFNNKYIRLSQEHEQALKEIYRLVAVPQDERAQGGLKGSDSSTTVALLKTETGVALTTRNTVELLEKRIKILESGNRKSSMELEGMRQEVERSRSMQNDVTAFTNENELSILRLEKDALRKKIAALETEIGFTSGQIDDKTRTRRYRTLEKNLNDYIVEIMSLEDKVSAKDRVISALKTKSIERRSVSEDGASSKLDHFQSDQSTNNTPSKSGRPAEVRSRLHQKVEELKWKSKFAPCQEETSSGTSSSSRLALIRQRLQELSLSSPPGENASARSDAIDDQQFDGVEI